MDSVMGLSVVTYSESITEKAKLILPAVLVRISAGTDIRPRGHGYPPIRERTDIRGRIDFWVCFIFFQGIFQTVTDETGEQWLLHGLLRSSLVHLT